MPATFQWSESNGVTPTITDDIGYLNFGSADVCQLTPATYPIVAGQNSFFKAIRVKFTDVNVSISNMLFWKFSGAYVQSEYIVCHNQSVYIQPDTAIHSAWASVPTDIGSALTIHGANGTDPSLLANGYTEYIFLQLRTGALTPAGAVNTKVFVFQYDEV